MSLFDPPDVIKDRQVSAGALEALADQAAAAAAAFAGGNLHVFVSPAGVCYAPEPAAVVQQQPAGTAPTPAPIDLTSITEVGPNLTVESGQLDLTRIVNQVVIQKGGGFIPPPNVDPPPLPIPVLWPFVWDWPPWDEDWVNEDGSDDPTSWDGGVRIRWKPRAGNFPPGIFVRARPAAPVLMRGVFDVPNGMLGPPQPPPGVQQGPQGGPALVFGNLGPSIMTVKNNDPTCPSDCLPIKTPTGQDVVIPAGGFFWLMLDVLGAVWRLVSSNVPVAAVPSGDLSGNYPSPTVAAIQGSAVSTTAPTDGQVLTWSAADKQYEPKTPSSGSGTVTSVSGGTTGLTVTTPTTTPTLGGTLGTANGGTGATSLAGAGLVSTGSAPASGNAQYSQGSIAAAGNSQGTATAIVHDSETITGADNVKGAILPSAATGARISLSNPDGTHFVNVYPATGQSIGTGAANAAAMLGSNSNVLYVAVNSTNWRTVALS